jgi:hypothetical protein
MKKRKKATMKNEKTFQCGSGEMGTLYWSKGPIRDWPDEMKAATPEQLEGIEIIRDARGIILEARFKDGTVVDSVYLEKVK